MTGNKAAIYVADDWLSISVPDRAGRLAGAEHLLHQQDWEEVVPGLDSLAVRFDPERTNPDTARLLFARQLDGVAKSSASEMREQIISVCYDPEFAPDSAHVAERLGIDPPALPGWHCAQDWTVDMVGFQPGFAYCRAEGNIPDIARLSEPRQSVPAGSIGLLGGLCGLYPFDGPGGWPLIGRTPALLFDARRNPPSLLSAGMRVRFEAIDREHFDTLMTA